jgi:hypothetical protein
MNTSRFHNEQGSVFITVVVAASILGIVGGAILSYLSNEYNLNVRGHGWNQSLHLAESAVEIGFAELNYQDFFGANGFQSARGWASGGVAGSYVKSVTNFSDNTGALIGSLTITVSGLSGLNPQILGVGTYNCPRGSNVTRAVQVNTSKVSQFPVAMMSKNRMDMNGNKIYTDSFDSTDVSKSTNGQYDAAKRQANGNVASKGTIVDSLNIGNAEIYGVAYTGVGGTVTIGAQGSVGPSFTQRDTTLAQALADGFVQSDFNVDVPDAVLPAGAGSWSYVGTGGGISKDTTLTSGDYRTGGISLINNSKKDTLTINGNVRLYVDGNVSLSGISQIIISSNSSLTVYVSGSVSLTGNGIINQNGTAQKDVWYGLTSSTSWTIAGNGYFTGAIYAPSATVSVKGGGSSGDFNGSIVANNITLTGQVKIHYDEALRQANTGAGYMVCSWTEMRNVNGAWVP